MKRLKLICLIVLIWSALAGWGIAGLPDGKLHLWFLDVGQGDAVLMRLPAGEWILSDGGPDNSVLTWLGKIMPFYEREFELVIVSHPHADHLNGLVEVLKRYKVNNILLTGVKYDYVGYERLMELAGEKNVKIWYSGKGDFVIGKTALDLIFPVGDWRGRKIENVNNSSIVFRLIQGNFFALFSGDLEKEKEAELIAETSLTLRADLLKAGHHGSKTSNTIEFLRRVQPEVAVISCGVGNKFRHPFPGTLENLREIKATIYRTDLDGTVEIVVGAQNFPLPKTWGKI